MNKYAHTSPAGPPSRLLLDRAKFDQQYPILDAGCGTGRNAIALAESGSRVIAVDKDRNRLENMIAFAPHEVSCGRIIPVCAALRGDRWPFSKACFSAVVCVHYLDLDLLDAIHGSIRTGGYLYIETVGGQGENYRELPKAGLLRELLLGCFDLELYRERPVGPPQQGRSAVKLLSRKIR